MVERIINRLCGAILRKTRRTSIEGQEKRKIPLLPCPFCGGTAVFEHETMHSHVVCWNCKASSKWFEYRGSCSSDEQALEAWNRRAGSK